jgi:hypothetical protein
VADPREDWVLTVIRSGVDLHVAKDAVPFDHSRPHPAEEEQWAAQEVADLATFGVFRLIPPDEYHKVRGVLDWSAVKQTNGRRLVVNGRPVAERSPAPEKFAYEDLSFVAESMDQRTRWFCKFDIRRLYYHIQLHRRSRWWCCIRVAGQLWQMRGLPMGVPPSPRVATLLLRPMVALLRRLGVHLAQYLDDALLWGLDRNLLRVQAQLYVQLLRRLGLQPHPTKCIDEPVQAIEFLGFDMAWSQVTGVIVSVVPRRRQAIVAQARDVMRRTRAGFQGRPATVRALGRLVGSAVSTLRAFYPAVGLCEPLYRLLAREKWDDPLVLDSVQLRGLRRLMAADLLLARPLLPPPDPPSVAVTTDASDWGWGAALSPAEAPFHPEAVEQARWPPPGTQLIAPTAVEIVDFLSQGAEPVPPAEPRLIHAARILDRAWAGRQPRPHETRVVPHSTEKESAAVLWGLLSFARQLRRGGHRFVLIRSDNIVALAAVARGWSSAASISRAAMLISFTARWLGLRLIPVHVPGVDNVLADEASRGWLPSNLRGRAELDWPCDGNVLKEELARHQCWLPEIDAFASFNNFKCKAFWSLRHEPGAAATDAMAQI